MQSSHSIITDYPVQEWNKFANDLIYTNRFSSSHKVVDVIKAHAKKSAATIRKGQVFYRARIYHNDPLREFLSNSFKNKATKKASSKASSINDYYNMHLATFIMEVMKGSTSTAFLDIVQGCSDETVGGFPIHVRMIDGKIDYSYSKTFQTGKEQLVKPGEAIVFDMRNSEGGFSFEQLPISEEEFMLKFDQMP